MTIYDYPDILTTDDVCEVLGISKTVCLKLIKTKKIKAFRINNSSVWKIPKKAVIEYTHNNYFTHI